jgi:hypothetical protein
MLINAHLQLYQSMRTKISASDKQRDAPSASFADALEHVARGKQTRMRQGKIDAILIYDAPYVGEPLDQGVDHLGEQDVPVGAVQNETPLRVAHELTQQALDLDALRLQVESGKILVARLQGLAGRDDLASAILWDGIEQWHEVCLKQASPGLGRQRFNQLLKSRMNAPRLTGNSLYNILRAECPGGEERIGNRKRNRSRTRRNSEKTLILRKQFTKQKSTRYSEKILATTTMATTMATATAAATMSSALFFSMVNYSGRSPAEH